MGIRTAIQEYKETIRRNKLYKSFCNEIYNDHIKNWNNIIKRVIDINNARSLIGLVRRDRFEKVYKFFNRRGDNIYVCALMYINTAADEDIQFYDNEWREYTENYTANKVIFEVAGRLASYNEKNEIGFIEFAIESFFGYGVTVNAIISEEDIKKYFKSKGARNQWELKLLTKLSEKEDQSQKDKSR